jgi:predicted nucleic acid-binding protein
VTSFVLDGSVTLSWCFEDESGAETEAVLEALSSGEAIVPPIWALEIANALLVAERRKRLTHAKSDAFVNALRAMSIREDPAAPRHPSEDLMSLARATGLTSYDASYLELAIRTKLPLATLDGPLRKAARARGVALLPARD